ncbi:MAG: alkaline phosphatase PhoX [Acidimicrobiia bacterium]|jgi:secreted PhoX family phosphatase
MSGSLDRREFLVRALAVSGAAMLSGTLLRSTLAGAATIAGPGPYGALAETVDANGFQLPAGFTSRELAATGSTVAGTGYVWHGAPDGGACFPAPGGGWVYVSNSELWAGLGGASALRFDARGNVVDAYRILGGTSINCAGGRTAAGKWLSCEEYGAIGNVYECDPLVPGQGVQRPALGSFTHEAAFEDPVTGLVYMTEDNPVGRLYRFVPAVRGDFSAGQLFAANVAGYAITWVATSATEPDRQEATTAFSGGEGLYIEGRTMYFTTKGDKRVWEVDLDGQTLSVLYDGVTTPNAALNAVDNLTVHASTGDVFVCEDGGNMEVCVIARNGSGDVEVAPFLRIAGHDESEWTGVAFSPDQTRMYLSSQRGTDGITGRTYEITGPFRSDSTTPDSAPVRRSRPSRRTNGSRSKQVRDTSR